MSSVKERVTKVRARRPFVDHVVRMVQHYGDVKGNLQAGAVTYFGFLSFFPILALAFAVIGYVAEIYPSARTDLVDAIEKVLPEMVSEEEEPGKIAISSIQDAAPGILTIGLPVMLYSGLGWLSAMRDALLVVFEKPAKEQPNFVVGKLKDLVALATLGVVLIVSVGISGVVTGLAGPILTFLQLGPAAEPVVQAIGIVLGLAAYTVLFFAFFKLLGDPDEPARSLWSGALLGALGFQVLTQLSRYLIEATAEQPAFQAFGIALILVVWINYFSRVVMYAAAWAHTSRAAREQRDRDAFDTRRREYELKELTQVELRETSTGRRSSRVGPKAAFAAGGASMLGLVALLRRGKDDG
ncbi:MAG: YihY/virulence factor BrkB family protein [Nocardioides sp.]